MQCLLNFFRKIVALIEKKAWTLCHALGGNLYLINRCPDKGPFMSKKRPLITMKKINSLSILMPKSIKNVGETYNLYGKCKM